MAHLGVLRELERAGIPVDFLAGTSMGALVGGVYAQNPNIEATIDRFRKYLQSPEFNETNPEFLRTHNHEQIPRWEGIFQRFANLVRKGLFYGQSLTKQAPISEEKFTQNINFLLEDKGLEETAIPLAVAALDLKSCAEVVLRQGSIRRAVSASCAIPGIMPPVKIEGWDLVDGGWIDRVPVHPTIEMGADFVIAVDVAEEMEEDEDFSTGLGVYLRSCDLSRCALSRLQLKEADLVLSPNVSTVHWSDFEHLDECVRVGAEAISAKMEELKSKIAKRRIRKFFHFPFLGKMAAARTSK